MPSKHEVEGVVATVVTDNDGQNDVDLGLKRQRKTLGYGVSRQRENEWGNQGAA